MLQKKKSIIEKATDGRDKYVIERIEKYFKGYLEEKEIWEKEMEEGKDKVFDKSVANALANSNIDMNTVKLKNNTK